MFNVQAADSQRLAAGRRGKGRGRPPTAQDLPPALHSHCAMELHNGRGPAEHLLSTAAPSITCPSETRGKSLTQRLKVPMAAAWRRREQGSARAGQVLCKGRVCQMVFVQKTMSCTTAKGEEKEKSCCLSPHQNKLKKK